MGCHPGLNRGSHTFLFTPPPGQAFEVALVGLGFLVLLGGGELLLGCLVGAARRDEGDDEGEECEQVLHCVVQFGFGVLFEPRLRARIELWGYVKDNILYRNSQ